MRDNQWQTHDVVLKYMLSDLTLFTRIFRLKVRISEIINPAAPLIRQWLPTFNLENNEEGYLLRSLPLEHNEQKYKNKNGYVYYIPSQFQRYYIDLQKTFDEYTQGFSSKTRSTIKRKIRKFNTHCKDGLDWKVYRNKIEVQDFYKLARQVSSRSYQEKLLDAGLPDSEEFRQEMDKKAEEGCVRAYLLFNNNEPVAYLYCPIQDNVLLYQYLGYDPKYSQWSVGTILHWFVFESLFNEAKFRYFDFTEGQSEHKRLYSTNSLLCGNIYIFRNSLTNCFLVRTHQLLEAFSNHIGNLLEKCGLKARIKKFIRS